MEIDGKLYCNVCMIDSDIKSKIVFVKAICDREDVHICTSCIPQVIHGSGEIVRKNSEIKEVVSS